MGTRWALAPAALAVAAAVGFVGVTGAVQTAAGTPGGSGPSAATNADWPGWVWRPGAGAGAGSPGYDSGSASAAATLSSTAAAAVEEITPSVVNIDTELDYGSGQAAGTGIVLRADGIVLTNHHVVEGATSITGTVVGTGRTYTATVLGYDPATDVALIDLAGAADLPVATLGSSDDVRIGDVVVGVGNAGGVGGDPTSVEGRVTALGQTITATDATGGNAETLDNLIGTSAAIQAGQSGGPLVDAQGDVVGVDVAASSGYTGSQTSGFAIPIDDAEAVATAILGGQETGTLHIGATPFLGVQLAGQSALTDLAPAWGLPGQGYGRGYRDDLGSTSDPGTVEGASAVPGVLIAGVVEGSAAQRAGLAAGDTITALDGAAVTSAEQLSSVIAAADVGAQMSVTWTDASGTARSTTVTLGAGPVG